MKTLIKSSIYAWIAGLTALQTSSLFAAGTPDGTFGVAKGGTTAGTLESDSLDIAIQKYVNYIMTFLYLLAVLYALWGGFQILTAGGDEEKVKKWKTILIQGAIGLFVIWIAGTLIKWILGVLAN